MNNCIDDIDENIVDDDMSETKTNHSNKIMRMKRNDEFNDLLTQAMDKYLFVGELKKILDKYEKIFIFNNTNNIKNDLYYLLEQYETFDENKAYKIREFIEKYIFGDKFDIIREKYIIHDCLTSNDIEKEICDVITTYNNKKDLISKIKNNIRTAVIQRSFNKDFLITNCEINEQNATKILGWGIEPLFEHLFTSWQYMNFITTIDGLAVSIGELEKSEVLKVMLDVTENYFTKCNRKIVVDEWITTYVAKMGSTKEKEDIVVQCIKLSSEYNYYVELGKNIEFHQNGRLNVIPNANFNLLTKNINKFLRNGLRVKQKDCNVEHKKVYQACMLLTKIKNIYKYTQSTISQLHRYKSFHSI